MIFLLLTIGIACLAITVVWPPPEEGPLRFIAWGIPSAAIVLGVKSITIPSGFVASGAIALGDASYSIYLFQFFALPGWARVMRCAGAEAVPFDINVLVLTGLVAATGFVGWLLVERPIRKSTQSWLVKAGS